MTRPVLVLSDAHRDAIVAHCLSQLPIEGCGLLAMAEGEVTKVYPTANLDESPFSYTVPPEEHFAALLDAEKRGWSLGGAFHSHPSGPAAMSAVDMKRALEPDWVYVVVGLGDVVEVSAWREGEDLAIRATK